MMIALRNISVHYGAHEAVQGVSVSAENGKLIALLGPNGSGKSSLIKAIAGLLPHTGNVTLDGKPALSGKARARQIAYLAQNRIGPPLMSVRDVIALGRVPHLGHLSRLSETDQRVVDEITAKLDLAKFSQRPFGQLSGGEQARVLLGRALAVQAPILLADEPIAALDPHYQLSTLAALRQYAKDGTLVITALHDLSLAECYTDEVWVMDDGKMAAKGPPEQALSDEILRKVFQVQRMSGTRFGAV